TPGSPRPAGPEPYQWGRVGADGMVSTVGDLFRWLGAIQAGRIMAEPARHKMFTAQPRGREGFGWHVARTAWGSTVIEKGGGSAEFASEILYFPDDRLVVIWICNDLRQRWRRALNTTIPAAALGREFLMPPPVARARTDVAPLAGAYDAEAGAVYLRAGDGYLYTRRNPAAVPDDVPFLPVTRMSFSAFDPSAMETMTLRFQRTPGGTLRAEFRRGRRAVILQKRGP
ncbi:MAG: serine hydrolase, partial [Gemmatimonadetes bacterium]|nr:serine hydrolase [Gemmatimonadota bacterium]